MRADLWTRATEIGERIADTAKKELKEETGLDVVPEYIIGIYSGPRHIIALDDGEVRQQFSICFSCRILGGDLAVSDESIAVSFFALSEIEHLNMHRSSLIRIKDYQEHRPQPVMS